MMIKRLDTMATPPPVKVADLWLLLELGISKTLRLLKKYIAMTEKIRDKKYPDRAIAKYNIDFSYLNDRDQYNIERCLCKRS